MGELQAARAVLRKSLGSSIHMLQEGEIPKAQLAGRSLAGVRYHRTPGWGYRTPVAREDLDPVAMGRILSIPLYPRYVQEGEGSFLIG